VATPDGNARVAEAGQEGADEERARIRAVFAQELPGYEKLIYTLAFETRAGGREAAAVVALLAMAAQVERDLADAVDGFTEVLRAQIVARRAQDHVDRQFAVGIEITFDDAIGRIQAEDAAQ
jgi:hypothetical protein